jgi:segregation and condensation protein A
MTTASVRLESFTGPLDLLLHLVRENEVDIHDISIAQIAEQYLKLIEDMKRLDIEVAGEFLVMAATLAELKVRQLLPRSIPTDDEELLPMEEEGDPRLDLIKQLLRFRFFKERAGIIEKLMDKRAGQAARPESVLNRLRKALSALPEEEETIEATPFMLAAVMKRLREETSRHGRRRIIYDDIPVEEKVEDILSAMANKGRVTFKELIEDPDNPMEVVTTFLAVLELLKQHLVAVRQIDEMETIVIVRPEDAPPIMWENIKPSPATGTIEIVRKIPDDPLLAELAQGLLAAHEAVRKVAELKRSFSDEAGETADAEITGQSPQGTPLQQPETSPAVPEDKTKTEDQPAHEDNSTKARDASEN